MRYQCVTCSADSMLSVCDTNVYPVMLIPCCLCAVLVVPCNADSMLSVCGTRHEECHRAPAECSVGCGGLVHHGGPGPAPALGGAETRTEPHDHHRQVCHRHAQLPHVFRRAQLQVSILGSFTEVSPCLWMECLLE